MLSQNTPVHIKLWHRDFWLLAFANLLIAMAVYMLVPVLPGSMIAAGYQPWQAGVCMLLFAVGMFIPGPLCSYLIQRFRRNRVCIFATGGVMVCLLLMLNAIPTTAADGSRWWLMALLRLATGIMFGIAQMVLMSTLVIDISESFQRTEANHASAWFGRLALSLGPVVAVVLMTHEGIASILLAAAVCSLIAALLVRFVKFPFKAPEENMRVFSLDRFFLPKGKWLFVNLMLTTAVVGMVLSMEHSATFYAMMMCGFLLSLLAQKFVFANAEIKSEVVSALILIGAALLMMHSSNQKAIVFIAPILIGMGTGIAGARYLLFFIKLSSHCQRGTSVSTYLLSWESGLGIGLCAGCMLLSAPSTLLYVALAVTVLSLAMYLLFTHSWFMKNKNR